MSHDIIAPATRRATRSVRGLARPSLGLQLGGEARGAQVRADGSVTREVADAALRMLDVDASGLDIMDRALMLAVIEKFEGGPVGVDNLAAAIGEERDTIEDVIEPFLIQQGYLKRTPRGRVATQTAYRHFGLPQPRRTSTPELWDEPS